MLNVALLSVIILGDIILKVIMWSVVVLFKITLEAESIVSLDTDYHQTQMRLTHTR
jgi:hypothetical protein